MVIIKYSIRSGSCSNLSVVKCYVITFLSHLEDDIKSLPLKFTVDTTIDGMVNKGKDRSLIQYNVDYLVNQAYSKHTLIWPNARSYI